MSFTTFFILIPIIIILVVVFMAWAYTRSSRELTLVRTGLGGLKVVMDSGVIVLPHFHKISQVNMQTLRLEIQRTAEQALITKDRLRVDVGVEFYVSVEPTKISVARALQTLGQRTFDAQQLQELIEGKLIDALRSVAAQLTMDELHEGRGAFVKEVKTKLVDELSRNGLELESVSLTELDQTPFSALDENNAFNAVGMRKLAAVIAESKKERASIDSDAEVSVRKSAMEAAKWSLGIELEEQTAKINQVRELETIRAAQLAEVSARKAEAEVSSNSAKIEMERSIRKADINREVDIRKAEIAQKQELRTAEQQLAITISKQSEAEFTAQTSANLAKAQAEKSVEYIETIRAIAKAERARDLELIAAEKEGKSVGIKKRKQAETEVEVSHKLAEASLTEAQAKAETERLRLSTRSEEMAVQAKGQRMLNEAENIQNKDIIDLHRDQARLDALPKIIEQMAKPAEKIDSIKIHHISGDAFSKSGGGEGGTKKTPVNQVLDSIMDMALQLPALKKIGEELGVDLEGEISSITKPKTTTDE